MEIHRFEFNPFPVNSYLVWDKESREAILIDAGMYFPAEVEKLKQFIEKNGLTVKHLIATHLHLDHNFGSPAASRWLKIPLEAHQDDEFLLTSMKEQADMFGMPLPENPIPIGRYLTEGDQLSFGNYTLQAIHVPGHSPGSLVYYSPEGGVLFAGDVLFNGSIGRTDLPGGDFDQLITGIKKKLLTLPDDTVVYPGHGGETSIEHEKRFNPYF